jgi:FG-GAP-like repeat/PASTA domain
MRNGVTEMRWTWILLGVFVLPVILGAGGCDFPEDPNTVSVLPNKGDGSFGTRFNYRTGKGPAAMAIGDLNGDGKPDLVTANYAAHTVSVLLADSSDVCVVPKVAGKTLRAAKAQVAAAQCRVGKIRRGYSKRVERNHVISQAPPFRRVLHVGGKVNLVVSRGRKR